MKTVKAQSKNTRKKVEPSQNTIQNIIREYIKDGSKCVVTFTFPKEIAQEANSVAVAGSFNGWDKYSHPLKKNRSGEFILKVEVDANREHEFRFVINENRWENAWNADKYVWSEYGNCDNSVIIT